MTIVFSGNCGRSMYSFRLAPIQMFIEMGHTVVVVLPYNEFTDTLRSLGITVLSITQMELSGTNPLMDIKLYREYCKIYKQIKPDLIFHYTIKPNIYGSLAAKKLGIRSIAVITGLGYTFINKGLVPALAKKMYRFALKQTSQIWFLNKEDKQLFEQRKIVSDTKTFLLNGEGIDTNYYHYSPIDTKKRSFILIGRLLIDKGVREYVEAAKILKQKYPQTYFKILGFLNVENPMAVSKEQLEEWTNIGVIEYLGSSKDVRPHIAESSAVVLPSYREGMSVTLMEAASMGRPLIATNIPGCKELIDDKKTGFICEVKNVRDLAEKMERLIKMNEPELVEMGKESREKMKREFSIDKVLKTYRKTTTGH